MKEWSNLKAARTREESDEIGGCGSFFVIIFGRRRLNLVPSCQTWTLTVTYNSKGHQVLLIPNFLGRRIISDGFVLAYLIHISSTTTLELYNYTANITVYRV